MARQDDALAGFRQSAQDLRKPDARLGIQEGRRLVQKQEVRILGEDPA